MPVPLCFPIAFQQVILLDMKLLSRISENLLGSKSIPPCLPCIASETQFPLGKWHGLSNQHVNRLCLLLQWHRGPQMARWWCQFPIQWTLRHLANHSSWGTRTHELAEPRFAGIESKYFMSGILVVIVGRNRSAFPYGFLAIREMLHVSRCLNTVLCRIGEYSKVSRVLLPKGCHVWVFYRLFWSIGSASSR